MAPTAGTRQKRARRQAEGDPSSPALDADITPAVKRRRLNELIASSPSTPKGFAAIKSVIGGAFGLGRRASVKATQLGSRPPVYDVPESSDDEEAVDAPTSVTRPAIKYKELGIKPPGDRKASESIYEVPDSGDELNIEEHGTEPAKKPTSVHATRQTSRGPKRKNSLPKKTRTGRRSAADDHNATSHDDASHEGTPSKRHRKHRTTTKADEVNESDQAEEIGTPKRTQTTIQRDKQQHILPLASKSSPAIKGILTPRHRKPGRPRKSVAFDSEDNRQHEEVYFEDLPSKSKTQTVRPTVPKTRIEEMQASTSDEEDEDIEGGSDEEVCAICSKPDSFPPNEIVFCENCDKAVHQKCYDVPVIPEDDWFCRECLQDDVVPNNEDALPIEKATTSKIPDMPNFELHLQTMRRVLVDRCSGRGHIKLQGQDEPYQKAFQLVEQTVLAGEGNSMMIIGARGSGKTTVSLLRGHKRPALTCHTARGNYRLGAGR
jgi:origin recognition complex subunit 4